MRLEGTYPVTYRGDTVGMVTLRRCGLYYEVCCICHHLGQQMLQLVQQRTGIGEDLGLLLPSEEGLELRKRFPVKRLAQGKPEFFLRCRNGKDGEFYAVASDQPVPFLQELELCVFVERDGKKGIVCRRKKDDEKYEINA